MNVFDFFDCRVTRSPSVFASGILGFSAQEFEIVIDNVFDSEEHVPKTCSALIGRS
jgi:hypothetical protein